MLPWRRWWRCWCYLLLVVVVGRQLLLLALLVLRLSGVRGNRPNSPSPSASLPALPTTHPHTPAGYEACVPRIVRVLERCKQRDVTQDYTYYGLASPWLQVKCLRVLQYFPPPEDPAVRRMLADAIKRILGGE